MPIELERLAQKIQSLEDRIGARNATQLDSSTIDVGDDDSLVVSDVLAAADEVANVAIPGLHEALDLNTARLQENAEAVAAALEAVDVAMELANAAEAAGIAAGEEASLAADDALAKAQEALDAAQAAGGGATYSGTAPAPGTPGTPGQQWFVWDSNYKITAYYVYDGPTSTWVQTAITDSVLGNISAGSITSGYLGAERIAAASLTAAVLAADTLTSREIGADAILARHIKAAEITGTKIAAATIAAGNIAAKTITAGQIAAGTITAGEIKAGTITANEIAAGTITATQINLDTLNGKTLTGVVYRSASSGKRIEIQGTAINVYDESGTIVGSVSGDQGLLRLVSDGTRNLYVGAYMTGIPALSSVGVFTPDLAVNDVVINSRMFDQSGHQWFTAQSGTLKPTLDVEGVRATTLQASSAVLVGGVDAKLGDTGWQPLSLIAGTPDGTFPPRVRRLNGVVYLDGLISPTAAGQTVATLPAGFRPLVAHQMWLDRNGATQWVVRVQASGNLALLGPSGGSGAINLGGFTPYPADN